MNPDEKCAAAQLKVQRLEAALAAFGDESSPEKEAIEGFLIRARIQAKVRPVEERLKSCEEHLERSLKKLEEVQGEVERTRARLARLKEEAASARQVQPRSLGCERSSPRRKARHQGNVRASEAPKERRTDAACSTRVVGLDEPQTKRTSGTSPVSRFPQCGVRVDFSVGRRSRTHAFVSGQTKRHSDGSRHVLYQCGLVGCRVGEASNPGPVFPSGREVTSSDEEPVLALVLPSTQPVSGTLPTWVDSDRPKWTGQAGTCAHRGECDRYHQPSSLL